MHPLNNGSQATTAPIPKSRVGSAGYFTESGESGAPSYPGADWFNACIKEFSNGLSEMGVTFNPDNFNHMALAFQAIKSYAANDATNKANQALSDAKTYADTQDASTLESAKSYAEDAGNLKKGAVASERLPEATTEKIGGVRLATDDDVTSATNQSVLTSCQLNNWAQHNALTTIQDINLDWNEFKNGFSVYRGRGGGINIPEGLSGTYYYALQAMATSQNGMHIFANVATPSDAHIRTLLDGVWSDTLKLWNSGNLPIPTQAQAEDTASTTPYAWTPQRIIDAVSQLKSYSENTTLRIGDIYLKIATGSTQTNRNDTDWYQTVYFDTPFPNAALVCFVSTRNDLTATPNPQDITYQEVGGTLVKDCVQVLANTFYMNPDITAVAPRVLAIGY